MQPGWDDLQSCHEEQCREFRPRLLVGLLSSGTMYLGSVLQVAKAQCVFNAVADAAWELQGHVAPR